MRAWLCLALVLIASWAAAEPITLAWEAVSAPDLDSYVVYWGTESKQYTNSLNVGNVTQVTISGLDKDTAYFFVVKARDTSGNESVASGEIGGRPDRVIVW